MFCWRSVSTVQLARVLVTKQGQEEVAISMSLAWTRSDSEICSKAECHMESGKITQWHG